MNEWKELKIDNLPSDILIGNYEFSNNGGLIPILRVNRNGYNIIDRLLEKCEVLYRKPEPLPKTHEEIMTLWWKDGAGIWFKVLGCGYSQSENKRVFYVMPNENREWSNYFTNRESAVIPPEVNKE